jgi:hypothetical protein
VVVLSSLSDPFARPLSGPGFSGVLYLEFQMTANITNRDGSFTYNFRTDGAVITFYPGKGSKGWPQSTLVSCELAHQHMVEKQADLMDNASIVTFGA